MPRDRDIEKADLLVFVFVCTCLASALALACYYFPHLADWLWR